jgi:hypothetical protein
MRKLTQPKEVQNSINKQINGTKNVSIKIITENKKSHFSPVCFLFPQRDYCALIFLKTIFSLDKKVRLWGIRMSRRG